MIRGEDIIVCTETWLGEADSPAQLSGGLPFSPAVNPVGGRRREHRGEGWLCM
jgi:hypothetical protein